MALRNGGDVGLTPAQLTWTNLKPRFQRQFATQTDEKMIMEGLSNLAMKPGESTGELLARITNTGLKIKQAVAAVQLENDDDEIAAFQRRKNKNFNQKKTTSSTASNATTKSGYKGYSGNYKSNTGPGNNANRNGKYCFYCKLQNHTQDECFKRIREKKPCRDRQGRAYWPRVYLTENSDSQNQGQQQGFH